MSPKLPSGRGAFVSFWFQMPQFPQEVTYKWGMVWARTILAYSALSMAEGGWGEQRRMGERT